MRMPGLNRLARRLLSLPRLASPEDQAPGLFQYRHEGPEGVARFHLRVEPDGSGLLLCNATSAARLNPSGVIMVRALLEGARPDEIAHRVLARFRGVSGERVREGLESVRTLLDRLSSPTGQYPVMNLDDPDLSPRASRLMAPFQAGVTLAEPEKMRPIIDRLWEIGIPHVNFRTWSNPVGEHLLRAVERAEDTGMIAGARVIASALAGAPAAAPKEGPVLLEELVSLGLDHLTVPIAATDPAVHDALFGEGDHRQALALLEQARSLGACAVAEFPLTENTVAGMEGALEMLAGRGIDNVSFFALAAPPDMPAAESAGALSPSAVAGAAARVEEATHEMNVRYFWQPPARRDPALALAEQVRRGPRAMGDVAIRVEPDGSVLPPRGPERSAGNLLREPWSEIWQDEAFLLYRERVAAHARCSRCPGLLICAADCVREPDGWSW